MIRVPGKGLVRVVKDNDPKNPQGTIALPEYAVEVLDRRWEQMQLRKREMPPPTEFDTQLGCGPDELIFPSFEWTLRDPVNVNHQWQRVREALGLPDDVVPYSLRKLVASLLDDEGLSARVTADVLQHADPAMTQRKYMERGRVHHGAAAVIHNAVMAGLGHGEDDQDAEGRVPTFGRLTGDFRGLETNSAPDRER
ncbi:tyrosine-type recombinase/integrase [Nocardia brasiliensis]|uniref:tyrosine-type recombinase/integrase n=1 Tax=Nocardia brasiliensis TaxID=37326 RepID=UPI0036701959